MCFFFAMILDDIHESSATSPSSTYRQQKEKLIVHTPHLFIFGRALSPQEENRNKVKLIVQTPLGRKALKERLSQSETLKRRITLVVVCHPDSRKNSAEGHLLIWSRFFLIRCNYQRHEQSEVDSIWDAGI